eukprot:COSAG06_NODE_6702_length_2819_cov_3.351838_4_plen_86_part_00
MVLCVVAMHNGDRAQVENIVDLVGQEGAVAMVPCHEAHAHHNPGADSDPSSLTSPLLVWGPHYRYTHVYVLHAVCCQTLLASQGS